MKTMRKLWGTLLVLVFAGLLMASGGCAKVFDDLVPEEHQPAVIAEIKAKAERGEITEAERDVILEALQRDRIDWEFLLYSLAGLAVTAATGRQLAVSKIRKERGPATQKAGLPPEQVSAVADMVIAKLGPARPSAAPPTPAGTP